MGVRIVKKHLARHGMNSLTCCQDNRIRVRMRILIVRRNPAQGPGMQSLTCCQANRTRMRVRTVRRYPARTGIK